MKPKHKRLVFVLIALCSISLGTYILLNNFKDNLVYFYSPKDLNEIKNKQPERFAKLKDKTIRVGGMIKEYQNISDLKYIITITDFYLDLTIEYTGLLPPMFRKDQGVVAQGKIIFEDSASDKITFNATELITKHDEKYMPPEIERSLNKSNSAYGKRY